MSFKGHLKAGLSGLKPEEWPPYSGRMLITTLNVATVSRKCLIVVSENESFAFKTFHFGVPKFQQRIQTNGSWVQMLTCKYLSPPLVPSKRMKRRSLKLFFLFKNSITLSNSFKHCVTSTFSPKQRQQFSHLSCLNLPFCTSRQTLRPRYCALKGHLKKGASERV